MPPNPSRTINIALNPQTEKHMPIAAYHPSLWLLPQACGHEFNAAINPSRTRPVRREPALPKRLNQAGQPNQSAFLSAHPPNTQCNSTTAPKQNPPISHVSTHPNSVTLRNSKLQSSPRKQQNPTRQTFKRARRTSRQPVQAAGGNCQLPSYNQAEEARREASRAGRITVAGVGDRARPPRQCGSGDQQQDEDRRRPGADAPAAPHRPHRSVGGRTGSRTTDQLAPQHHRHRAARTHQPPPRRRSRIPRRLA